MDTVLEIAVQVPVHLFFHHLMPSCTKRPSSSILSFKPSKAVRILRVAKEKEKEKLF